jgi:hypothetical protein
MFDLLKTMHDLPNRGNPDGRHKLHKVFEAPLKRQIQAFLQELATCDETLIVASDTSVAVRWYT